MIHLSICIFISIIVREYVTYLAIFQHSAGNQESGRISATVLADHWVSWSLEDITCQARRISLCSTFLFRHLSSPLKHNLLKKTNKTQDHCALSFFCSYSSRTRQSVTVMAEPDAKKVKMDAGTTKEAIKVRWKLLLTLKNCFESDRKV
jgi:hypothetical protein